MSFPKNLIRWMTFSQKLMWNSFIYKSQIRVYLTTKALFLFSLSVQSGGGGHIVVHYSKGLSQCRHLWKSRYFSRWNHAVYSFCGSDRSIDALVSNWSVRCAVQGVVCTLHEGDDFGKLALVNDAPRAASIVLREDNCHFLRVDKEDFNRILRVSLYHLVILVRNSKKSAIALCWQKLSNAAIKVTRCANRERTPDLCSH